ncbi:MAG TPA: hypothetical protein VFJ74_17785, partial [Gemmatimonadaceae bacterium]|nr:hypothetical protein [Gemmatimonadaceae bacterium]
MTTGPDITATTCAQRRGSAPPSVRRATVAAVVVALLGALACVAGGDAERGGRGGGSGGVLTVSTAQRATVVGFMHDTLSPAARISALYPGVGADSAVVAFVFADSARGVGAGLGVLDLRAPGGERMARLAWPDSVGAVWWSGPHVLAFVTQRGVTAKVDVNADTLAVALDSGRAAHAAPPATPPAAPPVPA